MGFRIVTGAFGYSGRHLAALLLSKGLQVKTLTNRTISPSLDPFDGRVAIAPLAFDRPDVLEASLRGAEVLYNTYWVRFNYRKFTFNQAVDNTRILFAAAKRAGVKRVVHVSITNPSEESNLEYFHGKALLERALKESGLSYAIIRPAVLFGEEPGEDILINNIAWGLRRMPVFGVFGDGSYRLQPIHVDDFAQVLYDAGQSTSNQVIDGIGPETFTYRELAERIAAAIGVRRKIISVPPALGYAVTWLLGKWVGDVILTRAEIQGLMENRLWTPSPPAGTRKLTDWLSRHANEIGRRYSSELARRSGQ